MPLQIRILILFLFRKTFSDLYKELLFTAQRVRGIGIKMEKLLDFRSLSMYV